MSGAGGGPATVATCYRPGGMKLTDRTLAAATLPPGAAVLDVGCGAGATAAHLVDKHGLRLTGLDAADDRVRQCRKALGWTSRS